MLACHTFASIDPRDVIVAWRLVRRCCLPYRATLTLRLDAIALIRVLLEPLSAGTGVTAPCNIQRFVRFYQIATLLTPILDPSIQNMWPRRGVHLRGWPLACCGLLTIALLINSSSDSTMLPHFARVAGIDSDDNMLDATANATLGVRSPPQVLTRLNSSHRRSSRISSCSTSNLAMTEETPCRLRQRIRD